MKINPKLNQKIDEVLLANVEEREPSGRLSAGKLGWALQHQMLHYFKVQGEPVDEYTLRKFQRGNDVEDRIINWINPQETQKEVWYRDVIGYVDMVWDEYPYEVKSITNMAFKYKQKEGPSRGHRLQAMHYALALGKKKFYIVYVASDDYRTLCFEEEVTNEVDQIIDEYEAQIRKRKNRIPVFEAREKWQAMKQYNGYPEWLSLNQEEINAKAKELELY